MYKAQIIQIGARISKLSQLQVAEVLGELRKFHPYIDFFPIWVKTYGDCDLNTSLRTLEKNDFFTKEIDAIQLEGVIRIAIHSAKDLPEPLSPGLKLAALTKGVSPADSLVFRNGEEIGDLPFGALIGSSSSRRDEAAQKLRPDFRFVDLRGTIEDRLMKLDRKEIDGLIVAEAALIRLGLDSRKRILLSSLGAPLQGRLAVVARENDHEMVEIFSCIDAGYVPVPVETIS